MVIRNITRLLAIIGPGLLVAATGVGAGDLATGSFAGSILGTAILWAVIVGALLKFIVTEGIARWQLATGSSVLEGATLRLGRIVIWLFLPYLLIWSYFTGSALISACGVTLQAIFPLFNNPVHGKVCFGILSSLAGLVLVYKGGYQLFEKLMRICIGIMFFTVVLTAVLLWPGFDDILRGLLLPTIPDFHGMGLTWTVALIGGVGGTVTVLSYGYWIREEGRAGGDKLALCRIDLAAGYLMTALFGCSVVIIGSHIRIEGSGAALLIQLSEQLQQPLGVPGKWLFLAGAFGAVFSSLLGVWQATPYFFADAWLLIRHPPDPSTTNPVRLAVDTSALPYRIYLFTLAIVPMVGLFTGFREVQKIYTITGAFFIPLLALVLLLLNGRGKWIGEQLRNRLPANASLFATLVFFLWVAFQGLSD